VLERDVALFGDYLKRQSRTFGTMKSGAQNLMPLPNFLESLAQDRKRERSSYRNRSDNSIVILTLGRLKLPEKFLLRRKSVTLKLCLVSHLITTP